MSEASHPAEIPLSLAGGRYRIGRSVGAGSSGTVYLAEDRVAGKPCAVKVREAREKEQPVRFIAEAQDMKRLRHPRLVPVLDHGHEGDLYWYVMPFYEKGCLRDVVTRQNPMPGLQAAEVVFQVLEGLHAVHAAGLVHRDVKPHNVLIGDDGGMLLADFGLARHVHGGVPYRTRTDQSMGTPNYRAPEQGVDAANVDLRADLYGAGATMFYLVTGRRPGFLFMVEPQDPEMDGVPEELKPFVLTCMAQRPEERYPDARACALALATVAERMDPGSASRDRWMARFDQLGRRSWLDRVLAWIRR